MNKPSIENHFVLCQDGSIHDLLENNYENNIEQEVEQLITVHGALLKVTSSPLKIFEEVVGLNKNSEFVRFGPTNWNNLFLIHGDFEYFLAYVYLNGDRKLVAHSTNGSSWYYNIIDA